MTPECPPSYTCTFNLKDLDPGPWWLGDAGIAVAIVGIIALTIVLTSLAYWRHERKADRQRWQEREAERTHKLAVEEQRTMQLDSAKGNPETLKIVRDMQNTR